MPTLEFEGKAFVYSHHLSVPYRELIPVADKGVGAPDLDGNLIVHGDNLEALKALLPRYAGKVDVIYIDPPYNTGNEGWAYNDNVASPMIKEWLGKVVDRDDLQRHDKWLCMMWPRLQMMKELLSDTGTIWINLDDTEAHSAKLLCDEIFGSDNFVTTVVWKKMDSPSRNDAGRAFSNYHDFILVYANSAASAELSQQYKEEIIEGYPLEWADGKRARRRQLRKNGKAARRSDRETMWYPLIAPDDTEVWPIAPEGWEGRWVLKKAEWERRREAGLTEWIKRDYGWVPYYIEVSPTDPRVPWSTIWGDVGQNRQAKAEAKEVLGGDFFETPKPTALVERIVAIAGDPDSVVLDCFAGSGTTGQAVMGLNARDGGERTFLMVQLPEKVREGSPAFSAGYREVVDLTRLRMSNAIKGVKGAEQEWLRTGLGGAFTYCELGEPMDSERFFAGEAAPSWEQVARYVLYTATGETAAVPVEPDDDFFAAEAGGRRVHVIYKPDRDFLRSTDAALTLERARAISAAAKASGKTALVFGAAQYVSARQLRDLDVTFAQLPWSVHQRLAGAGA